MKRFAAFLIAFLLLIASGIGLCSCIGPKRYSYTFLGAFDTSTTIIAYCNSKSDFDALCAEVEDELIKYHRYFDIYNNYDGIVNLKSVNDNAGGGALAVGEEIIDLLSFGKVMYDMSDGRLNIMFGAVLSLWHAAREAGIASPETASLPHENALREAGGHCRIDDLVIDEEAGTVGIVDPNASIDVGAIAKGFAIARVCDRLHELGYDNLLVNVGGNIGTIGAKPDGGNWLAAVQNPLAFDENSGDAEPDIAYRELNGRALATSGDYQRYYTVDGARYHHLIDPATLHPAAFARSVTVCAEDAAQADALSTALFLMLPEEAIAFANELDAGVEVFIVAADGTTLSTPGW